MREFEDYELIVGDSGLRILKAKGINFNLNLDLKYSALMILDSCQEYSIKRYPPSKANDICDVMYGTMLSNYINDKNLLKTVGENARKMAVTDASQRICNIVVGLIKK